MKTLKTLFVAIIVLTTFSCSNSETEKTTEEKTAEKIFDITNNAEGGLADALDQIQSAVKDMDVDGVSNKKPVNFRKLKELLPERANGFERTKASGESTGAMGFKVSTTKAIYEKGDQRIEVELTDAGGIGSAFMGMAAWSLVEVDKESDDGFERTTTYKGNKAFEKCNNSRCEFSVFIAKRFLVTTKGRNVDMDDLHDLIDDIDLDNLEDMKDTFGE